MIDNKEETLSLHQKMQSRIEELSFTPRKKWGQNFLVNQDVVDKIIIEAIKEPSLPVIEIGPGLGSLTDELIVRSDLKALVEIDPVLVSYWSQKGIKVINSDALRFDWSEIDQMCKKWILVSNLPYDISSRIVIHFSLIHSHVEKMVFMFQKEVADKITARVENSNYGILSVFAQQFWDINQVVKAGPHCFIPRPKIDSLVLSFVSHKTWDIDEVTKKKFLGFVKKSFSMRRKKLETVGKV